MAGTCLWPQGRVTSTNQIEHKFCASNVNSFKLYELHEASSCALANDTCSQTTRYTLYFSLPTRNFAKRGNERNKTLRLVRASSFHALSCCVYEYMQDARSGCCGTSRLTGILSHQYTLLSEKYFAVPVNLFVCAEIPFVARARKISDLKQEWWSLLLLFANHARRYIYEYEHARFCCMYVVRVRETLVRMRPPSTQKFFERRISDGNGATPA